MNQNDEQPPHLLGDAAMAARGVMMGGADVIPGVSGGTIALILGIYTRLVTAISHCDARLVALVREGRWRDAARHVDLRFLVSLGAGIVTGIVALGSIIHTLLENDFTRPLVWASFFGMVAASTILLARLIRIRSPRDASLYIACGIAGASFAWWLTTLTAVSSEAPSLIYIFGCGFIAICAMILPGISGAYILVILGVYFHITSILKDILHGKLSGDSLLTAAVFCCGCAIGLVSFSKVLRWLLAHHHSPTMALLCGFMVGALRKVWPFQVDTSPEVEEFKRKVFAPHMPDAFDTHALLAIAVGLTAYAAVLIVDWWARRDERQQPVAK